jgi:hypothetical protein
MMPLHANDAKSIAKSTSCLLKTKRSFSAKEIVAAGSMMSRLHVLERRKKARVSK